MKNVPSKLMTYSRTKKLRRLKQSTQRLLTLYIRQQDPCPIISTTGWSIMTKAKLCKTVALDALLSFVGSCAIFGTIILVEVFIL